MGVCGCTLGKGHEGQREPRRLHAPHRRFQRICPQLSARYVLSVISFTIFRVCVCDTIWTPQAEERRQMRQKWKQEREEQVNTTISCNVVKCFVAPLSFMHT